MKHSLLKTNIRYYGLDIFGLNVTYTTIGESYNATE